MTTKTSARSRKTRSKNARRRQNDDLKSALVSITRELLEKDGADRVSLRGVARAAKVSEAAPYYYFKNKDALLAAVAAEGFRELGAKLANPGARKNEEHISELDRSGLAYVRFARKNPNLFKLMFGPARNNFDKKSEELTTTAEKAYQTLESYIASSDNPPGANGRQKSIAALREWSLVHGLSYLLIDRGVNPKEYGAKSFDDLIRQVVTGDIITG